MTEILIKIICIITAVDSYSLFAERCHGVMKCKKILKTIFTKIQFFGKKSMCVFVHISENVKKYTCQTIEIIYSWWDKSEVQKTGKNCQYRGFSGLTSYY